MKTGFSRFEIIIVLIAMAAYIALAVTAGPDIGWDLRNYHFYNGYIFLHGGGEQNIEPAQLQSWFNPALDGFLVLLIQALPPLLVNATLGLLQSFNIPVLALLVRRVFPDIAGQPVQERRLVFAASLFLGITAPMLVSELGSSFGDALVSLFVLSSLVLIGSSTERSDPTARLAFAGFVTGLGCGLKLTAIVFAPGLLLCAYWSQFFAGRRLKSLLLFAGMAACGFLLTDGWWALHLWRSTGNPLFPAFNGIFHSPLLPPIDMSLEDRFAPRSVGAALSFPFQTLLGNHPGAEPYFRDPRFALAVLLLPLLCWKAPRSFGFTVCSFFYVSYLCWLALFGVERYLVLLELLSGIVLIFPLLLIFKRRMRLLMLGAVPLLSLWLTAYPDWINRITWDDIANNGQWFSVDTPAALKKPGSLFLILGGAPLSYVIPFFRRDAQFIRMAGNLQLAPEDGLYLLRQTAIAEHAGAVYTLADSSPDAGDEAMLAAYGLYWHSGVCLPVQTNLESLFACPLERR